MSKNIPRLIPVALAATLLLGACGNDGELGEPISTVADQPGTGSMRSPEPINVVSGSGGVNAAPTAQAADASAVGEDRMMIAPVPYSYEYVVGEGLGALPTNDTGYVFDVATEVTSEQVAALAAGLGVSGDPVRIDEGYGVSWRVGPDDGSAPTVYVYDDAQLSWNYNASWDNAVARSGCASPAVEPVDPAVEALPVEGAEAPPAVDTEGSDASTSDLVVEEPMPVEPDFVCDEPAPPSGILTADEAQQRATDLLTALGVDVSTLTWDNYADEWFASSTASVSVGDAVNVVNYSFGFGPEGVLQYANGSLATPEPVGPYTLIDLDTAIARLSDFNSGYGYGGGIATGVATATATDTPAIAIDEPMPVGESGDVLESGEPAVEPETVTVTLVDVQADYWWVWDSEGSAWLLPAYRFIDTDGGWHTVPAVTDDYLIEVEPPVIDQPMPLPEPMPVDPPETGVVEPVPASSAPADSAPAERVVQIEDIVRGVSYYPACMNETVEIDGVTWYPIADWGNDEQAALVDQIESIPRAEPGAPNGLALRVAEPGPGDDTGTLYIYADGIGRFQSDSGNFDVWLTTDELTYNWEC